ncbi:DUF1127 domain-containing protein [Inquilinus sp. CAU 1745]|uniref:DUF1127 domain-containing protein n=1 Tax=Inquilinus sp. CAU 1745 TaxID=3140369 RepID=UPI00325B8816
MPVLNYLSSLLRPARLPAARPDLDRLTAMTDAELADIGVRRGDVEAWAAGDLKALRRTSDRGRSFVRLADADALPANANDNAREAAA